MTIENPDNRGTLRARLALLYAGALLVLLLAPCAGRPFIGWNILFADPAVDPAVVVDREVFLGIRLTRALAAALAGGALAAGGVAFQALFRNPLTEPYVLGVSAGASAGIAVAVVAGGAAGLAAPWLPGPTLGGFIGALAAIGAVCAVSRMRGGIETSTLLLAGVALSFFFSSLVMLAQYLASPLDAARLTHALMGRVDRAELSGLRQAAPLALAGAAAVLFSPRELDLLSCGEEFARARGVDVRRARRRLFLGVSLMTAAVTALCGPIGFVGLMIPHGVRRMFGPGHRVATPAAMAAGAAFLAGADALGRWAAAPREVPVGLTTALLGGPFFLWLLVAGRREE